MKKILLFICLFFISPFVVSAVEYDIPNFLVESKILPNGDLDVKELIVLDGTFNGYERDILYANQNLKDGSSFGNNALYNASNITDMKISAKYVKSVSFDTFNETFDQFSEVKYASLGDKAKYILTNLTYGYRYRMYYKANSEKVAFLLHYTVKNAVVLHEDVAELYWTFIPSGFEDDLKNIEIKVYLPNTDNSDNFRIWAHGNLIGNVNYINKNGIYATIEKVSPGESVDIRTTFNKSLITDTRDIKKTNVVALDKIVAVETERANVANELRATLLRKYNGIKYATIALLGSMVLLGIYLYYKYGKSPKSGYYSKYNREFIDDYNVEVIDYLMNRKITPNAMSASIMNLIYKKNISASEIANTGKSKKKDYSFVLEKMDNTNESEQILIDFLFHKVGKSKKNEDGKQEFTTIDLKAYASGTKTCETFVSSYTKWKNNILKLGKNENFYDSSSKPKLIGFLVLAISFILIFLATQWGVDYFLTYLCAPAGIIFFIYSLMLIKKTKKGSEHYDKWKAFKNFLNDFGAFDIKELPEIALWERYLVYAVIFGLADKVQKSMNVKIKELDITDTTYYPSFYYYNFTPTINSSVSQAISSAYSRQAANYANSHSSSSSGGGFGGGFSSGGGFGGGGGGGRGF